MNATNEMKRTKATPPSTIERVYIHGPSHINPPFLSFPPYFQLPTSPPSPSVSLRPAQARSPCTYTKYTRTHITTTHIPAHAFSASTYLHQHAPHRTPPKRLVRSGPVSNAGRKATQSRAGKKTPLPCVEQKTKEKSLLGAYTHSYKFNTGSPCGAG